METVRIFRGMERRILPYLQPRLDERRICHIRAVNNAFAALVEGKFAALFDALPQEAQKESNFDAYCRRLAGVRSAFRNLSPKEKEDLSAAVVLHDIGYLEDKGINHNDRGRELGAHFLNLAGAGSADREVVAELLYGHGLYSDATAQFMPADLKHFSPARKTQLLIMSIIDAVGKPDGSRLSQRVLDVLINTANGSYDRPELYFKLRFRSLLGPTMYSYLEDNVAYVSLMEKVMMAIPGEDRQSLIYNVTTRFRNMCWPVFHDLVNGHQGIREFLTIMLRLSRLADEQLADSKDVLLVFQPDFFNLTDEQRKPYIQTLLREPAGDYLQARKQDEHGILVIDLDKLINNSAGNR